MVIQNDGLFSSLKLQDIIEQTMNRMVNNMAKKNSKTLRRIMIAAVLFFLDGLAMIVMKKFSASLYPAYRVFSKFWIGLLAKITSFVPVAVWDIMLIILIVLLLYSVVHMIRRHISFWEWLTGVILAVSVLAFSAVYGWMLNHYSPDLAYELGYTVRKSDKEELYEACDYYLMKASEYAVQMDRDNEGHLIRPDYYEVAEKAGSSYVNLGKQYPALKGSAVRVKKLSVVGEYLMYNGIIGMFMPLSGEAGTPASVPTAPLAYTMAHEAAHRCGIASEEDANFAAFLACMDSEDLLFKYCGYYSAFSYCFSSLSGIDSELAASMYEKYEENPGVQLVRLDRRDTRTVYDSYESRLQDISDEINDTYLKAFSEESGIQSYGEVTDDLLAYYRKINVSED